MPSAAQAHPAPPPRPSAPHDEITAPPAYSSGHRLLPRKDRRTQGLSICPSSVKGACTVEGTALPCQPDHLAFQGLESGPWLGTPDPPHLPTQALLGAQGRQDKRNDAFL